MFRPRRLLHAPIQLETRHRTREGYLRADAAIVRSGVYQYTGAELGVGDRNATYGVLLDRDSVFAAATRDSARMKPITFDHPGADVTVDNYAQLAVGHMGDDVREMDGDRLGASVVITAPAAVAAVEHGVEEMSIGFYGAMSNTVGEHDGHAYQYRFNGPLEINHVAIVETGRAGRTVRILNAKGGQDMTDDQIKEAIKDGIKDGLAAVIPQRDTKAGQAGQDPPTIDVDAMAGQIAGQVIERIGKTVPAESKADADPQPEAPAQAEGDAKGDTKAGAAGSPKADANSPADQDKEIALAASARTRLIVNAQPLLPKDKDPHTLTNREIMIAALGDSVQDADKKSDEYLQGQLDAIVATRGRATDERRRLSNISPAPSPGAVVAPTTFLDMRAQLRGQQ